MHNLDFQMYKIKSSFLSNCCKKNISIHFQPLQVGGIVVMAIGIWTCVDHSYMEQLMGTNLYMSAAYILIATGVVVILVSFLGCFGAVKEIKCMLLTVSS